MTLRRSLAFATLASAVMLVAGSGPLLAGDDYSGGGYGDSSPSGYDHPQGDEHATPAVEDHSGDAAAAPVDVPQEDEAAPPPPDDQPQ